MPRDNFTMSENSGSFGMQQRQDRFDAIGDLIVGPPGPPGPQGPPGADGTVSFDELTPAQRESLRGEGVPAGGTTGQVLAKSSNTDYATRWVDAGGNASLTILSYGNSTWNDFITAYNANSIVYCRASSAADPSSGSQTRLAFMAYVNSAASPTSVEFQYYRSVSSHSDAQQGDQVFVYKLTNAGTWSVETRNTFTKIAAGTNMSSSYANGTLTLNATGGGTADALPLAGGTMQGVINMDGNKVSNLPTPTANGDAVPKSYVDGQLANYRTSTAQDAIDAAQDEQIEAISHRNLLDNWYFVGGGSQNGDGVFPINQRGQTSYPNAGYTIDRWRASNSALTVTLNSNYVDISNSNASTRYGFECYVKSPNSLRGKTLTASFIMPDGTLKSGTANIPATIPASNTNLNVFNFGENSTFRIEVRVDGDIKTMLLIGANETISITAVKLEIGSYQTLAHQENGVWVLNEIPDYGEELEKCRRYFRVLESTLGDGNGQYFVAARGYSDASYINVAVEPPMMGNIVPSLPDGIQGAAIDGAGTSANLSGVNAARSNKSFGIRAASNLARTPIAVYLNKRIYLSTES